MPPVQKNFKIKDTKLIEISIVEHKISGEYTLVIRGRDCYIEEGGTKEIESGVHLNLPLNDSNPQDKGIINAIINLAKVKLRQEANLE